MANRNPFRNLQADALEGEDLHPVPRRDPRAVQRNLNTKITNMRQQLQTLLQMQKTQTATRLRNQIETIERGLSNLEYKHQLAPIRTKCENFEEIRKQIHDSLRENPMEPKANFEGLEFATSEQLRIIENDLLTYFTEEFGKNEVPPNGMKLSARLYNSSNHRFWRNFPLSPACYKEFLRRLRTNGFIVNFEEAEDFESDQAERPLPEWSEIREFFISPLKPKPQKEKRHRAGGFFPYKLSEEITSKPIIDELKHCQIVQNIVGNESIYNDSCWIYALKEASVPKEKIVSIIMRFGRISDAYFRMNEAIDLAKEQNVQTLIHFMDNEQTLKTYPEKKHRLERPDLVVDINMFCDHYFLEYRTNISRDYLNRILLGETVPDECCCKRLHKGKWEKDRTHKNLYSSDLVRTLMKHGMFKRMTFGDYAVLPNIENPNIDNFSELEYNPEYCISDAVTLQKQKEERKKNLQKTLEHMDKKVSFEHPIYFADTEADPIGSEYHRAYMLCIQSEESDPYGNPKYQKTFSGDRCIESGLKWLPDNAIVYFHNLGYDINFFAKFGASGVGIIKGRKTYTMNITYHDKTFKFKDSLALIPKALKEFPKMFGLNDQQKEVFPYNYYTMERFMKRYGNISEAEQYLKPEDREQFRKNIVDVVKCFQQPDNFDMWKYCEFYCMQDVSLLRKGFMKFRSMTKQMFDIDALETLTSPSLANAVFTKKVYAKNPNIKYLSGLPAEFIRKAIYGGRCMCRRNKRWRCNERLLDFDACSLYPSAIARLEIPLGVPKVFPTAVIQEIGNLQSDHEKVLEYLKRYDAYVIEVKYFPITDMHRDFPLFVTTDENGNNLNTDEFHEPIIMTQTHIGFQEILRYYPTVRFEILRGYYWDEAVDTGIQNVIRDLYNQRVIYKKQKNPLQEVLKLIMNSAYGKTIQKFIESQIKFVPENDVDKFWRKNYNSLIEDMVLEDSDIHKMCVRVPVNHQYTPTMIGALVLDMSKRIMNEVMCLAEDIGCVIYYQDTDSMHIRECDLPKLVDAYRERYHRELIGKDLGQFHNDFDSDILDKETTVSQRSYFIGKKIYIDELTDKNGNIDYHIRMKGISNGSIKAAAEKFGGLMELYKRLYEGEEICFDLLASGKPSFEIGDAFTIQTRREFFRNIQAMIPKGEDDSRNFLNGFNQNKMETTEEKKLEVETEDRSDVPKPDAAAVSETKMEDAVPQQNQQTLETEVPSDRSEHNVELDDTDEETEDETEMEVETETRDDEFSKQPQIVQDFIKKYSKGFDEKDWKDVVYEAMSMMQSIYRNNGRQFELAVENYLNAHLPKTIYVHPQFWFKHHHIDFVLSYEADPKKVDPKKSIGISCKQTINSSSKWRDDAVFSPDFAAYILCCSTVKKHDRRLKQDKIYVPNDDTFMEGLPSQVSAIWIFDADDSHQNEIAEIQKKHHHQLVINNSRTIKEIESLLYDVQKAEETKKEDA